ncbi:hypothetical protein [Mangrovibacterium marinum]|uniref:hypothetical protein n=1 Tax=Mangrovibacterium marinum TaxID=1639118 RepID=UPI000D31F77D|nr:hypothetical protein [Mangrovibacterium marinum]
MFFGSSLSVLAQNNTRSPYSMYGLGELRSQVNAVNTAMGGAGMAMSSQSFVNVLNPAANHGIDSLNVIFDTGVEGKYSQFKSQGETQNLNTGNFSYFSLGFRINSKISAGIGLNPFSSTGYEINSTASIDGVVDSKYPLNIIGTGDISRAWGVLTYDLLPNLHLGARTSFLFGSVKQTQYHNLSGLGNTSIYNETTNYFHNFYFEFGAQYEFKLQDYNISLGAIYNPGQKLVTKQENQTYNSSGTIMDDDTQYNGDFKIPEEFGFGIAVNSDKFLYLVDAGLQKWSDYDYKVKSVELKNTPYLRLGLQFTPSRNFMDSYFQKVNYRIGWRYAKSYLEMKGNQLEEYVVTFGLGLPIRNQSSRIDCAFELGSYGTTASRLIQENYIRLRVGFSLKDLWFQQRKFN